MILPMTTFRFWAVVFLNVGVVYAGKMIVDDLALSMGKTEMDRTLEERERRFENEMKTAESLLKINGKQVIAIEELNPILSKKYIK